MVVDGVDLARAPLSAVRGAMRVITQDVLLLEARRTQNITEQNRTDQNRTEQLKVQNITEQLKMHYITLQNRSDQYRVHHRTLRGVLPLEARRATRGAAPLCLTAPALS